MESKWWSSETIALVTGSSKGIGLQIVRELARAGITVILTSRDEPRGQRAVQLLRNEGLHVLYHQLDVCNPQSVTRMASWISEQFGELHILINNAGVMLLLDSKPAEAAETILDTNYHGVKRVTEAMLPLMRSGSRIININSKAGDVLYFNNEWKATLQHVEILTTDIIDECLREYLEDVRGDRVMQKGWPGRLTDYTTRPDDITHYLVSKTAVNAYTRILHKQLDAKGKGILINCMCPGLTATDMTEHVGHSVEVGADTAVWLALLPSSSSHSGEFFMRRESVGFCNMPFYIDGQLVEVAHDKFSTKE